MMATISEVACEAYKEAVGLLDNEEMKRVVTGGLAILYGPPVEKPDLFLISFQGGGAAPIIYESWPKRLLYLDDEWKPGNAYKFGRNLCRYCRDIGLYDALAQRTFAVPAVFPGASESEAGKWLSKSGPRAAWREFSIGWVEKLVKAASPRVVIVFGTKTSNVLNLDGAWSNRRQNHGQGWLTYGETYYLGFPTIYCMHLTRFTSSEVLHAFTRAAEILEQ